MAKARSPRVPRNPDTAAHATPRGRAKKERRSAETRGLRASELLGEPPTEVRALVDRVGRDGGQVLGVYREPLGGTWVVCAGLPIERVAPTAFQRDLSPAHARRLEEVIVRIGRFLDPVIAVPGDAGYLVPNGHHRLEAMRALGARAIVALVVPESKVAYQILALNTEKAHNVKEKALEVVRMAQELARLDPRAEAEFALEFEEPALLTLGLAYAERPRFAGGAYGAVLRRVEEFLPLALPAALERRRGRAAALLRLDDAVSEVVARLKERGLDSPYLKAFVVARIHPARFHRGAARPDPDGTLAQMTGAAVGFDVARVRPEQLAATAPIGDG